MKPLMKIFHIEMDDLLKVKPGHGVTVRDNDLILDPSTLLPPPSMRGAITSAAVVGRSVVQTFGDGKVHRLSPPATSRNFIYWRGGSLAFGKLTMTATDLELVDMDPKDPFDFSVDQWNEQLVAGYSKTTSARGLKAHMPDYNDLPRKRVRACRAEALSAKAGNNDLMVPLSVLDLAPIVEGGTAADAFRRSLDLAQHCERWGYRRYWLAEHHNMPGIASAATAVLIGHIGAGTTTIRVGAGGIMLPNHSPLQVAEQFGTLEALFPGRVDLGLGRAPGTDHAAAFALRRTLQSNPDEFPNDVMEVIDYFRDVQPGQQVQAVPGRGLTRADLDSWLQPVWRAGRGRAWIAIFVRVAFRAAAAA